MDEELFYADDVDDSSDSYSHSTGASHSNSFNYPEPPIIIGYMFGPKKMSTMGVVMAEASKVQVIREESSPDTNENNTDRAMCTSMEEGERDFDYDDDDDNNTNITRDEMRSHEENCSESSSKLTSAALESLLQGNMDYTQAEATTETVLTFGDDSTDLQQLVRYFKSKCSSAASVSETTVSTPTTTRSFSKLSNSISHGHGHGHGQTSTSVNHSHSQTQNFPASPLASCKRRRHFSPIRLSFVPLDPDYPLEEQHCGKFDLILHKLTEDILACSLQKLCEGSAVDGHNFESFQRIDRLCRYQRDHPQCCMVDDPKNVEVLMSRCAISDVLQSCLEGVTSSSGIPAQAPNFLVWNPSQGEDAASPVSPASPASEQLEEITKNLVKAKICFPLIAKPVVAAGTKQSHRLSVILQRSGLLDVLGEESQPVLLQEYINHDARLYKVYVMGDYVSVYERTSLPNLPTSLFRQAGERALKSHVKFDSQRPYPSLSDFGLPLLTAAEAQQKVIENEHMLVDVTVDEVRPLVKVLKQAFGLELFGFDVLLTTAVSEPRMVVVDVNFFPSYKEVPNFPGQLAQYLAQRVLKARSAARPSDR